MKYGLIVYIDTDNIGDDILSYAASKFLPSVDYIIDRERMDTFLPDTNEYVKTIINGWFLKNKFNWPPSEYILPFFIGTHFSSVPYWGIKDEFLDSVGAEYLKKYEPIGCRDNHTVEKLKKRGVDAYFSGCVTLSLERFENVRNTEKIILVDVSDAVKKCVSKKYRDVEIITHSIKPSKKENFNCFSWDERARRVEELLKKYQGAKLVITTRLHCALPCLALGTNVIMIKQNTHDYENRIGTYERILTCLTEDELSSITFDTLETEKSTIAQNLGISICQKIQAFLQEDIDYTMNIPDISEYERLYNKKLIWQKNLLKHNEKIDVDKLFATIECQNREIKRLKKWCDELTKGKNWLENKYTEQKYELQELKKWCDKLQEGKDWLEGEYNKLVANESIKNIAVDKKHEMLS